MCFFLALIGSTAMSETNPKVQFETSKGTIVISLNAEKAPKTVENFLAYVNSGFYDGTVFHRVIPSFMIQGGGFDADMQQKPTNETIENEANNGLKNVKGSIAMARTSAPHSATAQFFTLEYLFSWLIHGPAHATLTASVQNGVKQGTSKTRNSKD